MTDNISQNSDHKPISSDAPNEDKTRVSYLIGAGGSHASVNAKKCPHGILMNDLITDLARNIRNEIESKPIYKPFWRLVNDMADPKNNIDVEHLITFCEESPSALHNEFAKVVREAFHSVLEKRLNDIEKDIGHERFYLYERLFKMHKRNKNEILRGILTLNYDDFIEEAAKRVESWEDADLDFCRTGETRDIRFLKLHGSFFWNRGWPLQRRTGIEDTLWIPPGIQKRKDRYPFNILWGMARDVLDCDVLRVIGCRLGANDWDLISLIFSTQHTSLAGSNPYTIEIIDSLKHANKLKKDYPYLDIKSLVEIETYDIGRDIENDLPTYGDLSKGQNWFLLWLETMYNNGLGLDINEEDP